VRTVLDARSYILRLSRDRERSAQWQRAGKLVLAKADVGSFSRQVELALLFDGMLTCERHFISGQASFDHLVGAGKQSSRHREAKRLSSLEVDQ
jgi:hypothetical protein